MLTCEPLEVRRLMIAEGDVFELSASLSSAGLVGSTSAAIQWGDGFESPATSVNGSDATGPLRIRFDYSLDSGNFFGGANQFRRAILQTAADAVIHKFADNLSAITPAGKAEWIPAVFHPSSGPANQPVGTLVSLPRNLVIASNEIIIYAGARDLPGNRVGVGGTGSYSFPAASNLTPAEIQQINAFRELVAGRGQAGALASPQTDLGPWGGSISFDSQTQWYFGNDASGIGDDDVDFISIATHEIAHVLGFGINRTDATTSWDRLASSTEFAGPKARAAYQGNGNVPLQNDHWAAAVLDQYSQPTLMAAQIPRGKRQLFTELDFAAMDDIGWDVLSTKSTITANHRFPDDGNYPVRVVLRGSRSGEIVHEVANVNVTNQAPSLAVQGVSSAVVGQSVSINDLGSISDPGFSNNLAQPPTQEVFTYTINWGDSSPVDSGSATIDSRGNGGGALTLASFDGLHQYTQAGRFTVVVRVTDDDSAAAQGNFVITVSPPPVLSLQLGSRNFSEDSGDSATTLTVLRSGPATGVDQTVSLTANDPSELRVPPSVVIPGDATSVTVDVDAVDDALLDGDQLVEILAQASGLEPATIDLIVADHESLSATLSGPVIDEDAPGSVNLSLSRSNTDTLLPLTVSVTGGDPSQIELPLTLIIPANEQGVDVPLRPINDSVAESKITLTYSFTAIGYEGATVAIGLVDDEPPAFQNLADRFDVNNDGRTSALDALRVINELARRGGPVTLTVGSGGSPGVFVDVNGDYRLSALDALQIINELARRQNATATEQSRPTDVGLLRQPPWMQPIDGLLSGDDDQGPAAMLLASTGSSRES